MPPRHGFSFELNFLSSLPFLFPVFTQRFPVAVAGLGRETDMLGGLSAESGGCLFFVVWGTFIGMMYCEPAYGGSRCLFGWYRGLFGHSRYAFGPRMSAIYRDLTLQKQEVSLRSGCLLGANVDTACPRYANG